MSRDSLQRMAKVVGRLRQGQGRTLHMSWDDLVNAETKGRWWRTGARWVGREPKGSKGEASGEASGEVEGGAKATKAALKEDQAVADAAAALRMNTDVRRRIFAALMGADGVEDALDRLGDAKVRGSRDVPRVLVECCAAEDSYNPYYAAVARRLCGEGHRFGIQLCFWDALKAAPLPPRRTANLANLLGNLAGTNSLSLASALKPLDLLSPALRLFLAALLDHLLMGAYDLAKACARLGASAEALAVRDSLIGECPLLCTPPWSTFPSPFICRPWF